MHTFQNGLSPIEIRRIGKVLSREIQTLPELHQLAELLDQFSSSQAGLSRQLEGAREVLHGREILFQRHLKCGQRSRPRERLGECVTSHYGVLREHGFVQGRYVIPDLGLGLPFPQNDQIALQPSLLAGVRDEVQLLCLGLLQRSQLDTLEPQHLSSKLSRLCFTQPPTHKAAVVWEDEDLAFAVFWYPACLIDNLRGIGETGKKFAGVVALCGGEGEDGLDFGPCWRWVGPNWLRGGRGPTQGCGRFGFWLGRSGRESPEEER